MALDDYATGEALRGLLDKGALKEDELDNSDRVKLRSYDTVKTGETAQGLLDKGAFTQEDIDKNPELKLGVQAYNTQRELDKGLLRRFGEAAASRETLDTLMSVNPAYQVTKNLLNPPKQIDLTGIAGEDTEPSAIQRFVGENLPEGVINTLADIQPTLAVAGETATAGALKLPKVREPGFGEEMVGIALGIVPQILVTRGTIGNSIRELATARNLNPLQTEIILDLASTELSRAAALGIEDQFLPPEQRRGPGGITSQLAWEGAGSIGGTGIGAGIARAGGALAKPGTFEAVPGFRQALKRAEASLTGTADEFPPGTIDDIIERVETEGQRAFREALEEVSTQTQPARQATRTATRQPTTIIPDEFQAPTTRRTPLEQEFGLPKGSDAESPAPAAAAAEEPVPAPKPKKAPETPPEAARATESTPEPETRAETKYEGIETHGIREDRLDKLREAAANARVLKDIEEQFGVTVPRKAKTEALDAEKVATATEKAQTGELTGKEKLTTTSRKADSTLEKILYNPQKSASRNAKRLGLSKEQFNKLRDEIGERAIAEETASGALRARRETMIRAILDEGTTLDKDKEALLRAELDDLTIGQKALISEDAINASTPKTVTRDIVQEKNIKLGADEEVVTPANTKAKTKFAVVDSSDIKTSFDEGFPQELQNRLRGTRVASTGQIERIASQLDPEQLGSSRVAAAGAPIISKEGNVLVGNGRVTALRQVLGADDVPAGNYRDFLKKNAEKFGIDPKQVDELDSPVLVRVLGDDVDEFKFVREANESVGQQLSATEKALDDASRLSDETLTLLKDDDLALDKSTEFINRFAREVIGPSEMNSFVDSQGRVSAEGKRRIRNAIFARAFDDVDTIENVVESNDQNFKNISNALFTTSPAFAKTKGGKFGVNERLIEAVDQLVQAKKRGIRLDQQLAQRTIGGKDPDNVTKALAQVLDENKAKPAVLKQFMTRLADATARAEQSASQPSLLGSVDKIDTQEILETVVRRVADEGYTGQPNQKGLFQKQQAASGAGSDAPSGRQTSTAAAGRGGEDTGVSPEVLEEFADAQALGDKPKNAKAILDDAGHLSDVADTDKEGVAFSGLAADKAEDSKRFLEKNLKEGLDTIKKKSEKGSITISRPVSESVSPEPDAIRALDSELEGALNSRKDLPRFIRQVAETATGSVRKLTEYEPLLQGKYRFLEPIIRRFQGRPQDANHIAKDMVFSTLHPLLKDTNPRNSFDVFRRYVAVKNAIHDVKDQGLRTFRDVSLDTLESYAKQLENTMTPNIRKALELHKQLVQITWKEMIYDRGLHPSPKSPNEWYFPREVLDYAGRWREFSPWVPSRKFAQPARVYLKGREGSVRDINTDYIDVMTKHISRLEMDKAVEDLAKEFIGRTAVDRKTMFKAAAETWRLPVEQVEKMNPVEILRPGAIYKLGDDTYKVFRYNPSRDVYAGTPTERFINDIIETIDLDANLASAKNDVRALLPIEIAERLEAFNTPKNLSMAEAAVRGATTTWKEVTLNYAFAPYQMVNAVGDSFFAYYLERPSAMRYIPRAFRALRNGQKGVYDEVFERMSKERLTEAGIYGEMGIDPTDKRFKPFLSRRSIVGKTVLETIKGNPLNIMHTLNEIREGTIRGSLMLDLEAEIAKGKRPRLKWVNLDGIETKDIPGMGGREITIDYNKVTPEYSRSIRSALFPFATFYYKSVGILGSYAKKRPAEAAFKLAAPYVAMQVWNNTYTSDIEERLPSWRRVMPHINTGIKDHRGRDVIYDMALPWNTFVEVFGLGDAAKNITKVRDGKMTPEEAFTDWAKSVPENIFGTGRSLLNPFIGRILELAENKKALTGAPIIKESEKGTTKGLKKQIAYLAEGLFTPVRIWNSLHNISPETDTATKAFGMSPLDFERAVGISRVGPEKGKHSNQMEKAAELKAQLNDNAIRLTDAYIESRAKNDPDIFREEMARIKKEGGPIPTREQLRRRQGSVDTRKEIVLRKWRMATGEEKVRLEEEYNRLLEERRGEQVKRQPKAIRPALVEEQTEDE